MRPIRPLCVTTTKSLVNYGSYKTSNRWRSVDAHFNVLSIHHLRPLIIIFILIWLYRLSFWMNKARPCGKAERDNNLALCTLTWLKIMYHAKRFIAPAIYLFMNRYSHATSYNSPIIYLSLKLLVMLHKAGEPLTHSILLFFPPLFLRVSAALTITNNFSACLFDLHVGQTNPGPFGAALTSCCSGHSGSSMPLFCSISDSSSAV